MKKINEILTTNKTNLFIILYSRNNISKIKKYLNKHEPFEFVDNNNINFENIKNDIKNIFRNNNINLVYSNLSGTGKSTYISNLKRSIDELIYFPLGGNLNKKKLKSKLKNEIKINENKLNIIHIDLYDSLNEKLIKEFLFDFLLFKFFGEENDFINYGFYDKDNKKIKIVIELPNTHKNYFNTYKILNYLPIEKKICLKENSNTPILIIEDSKIKMISKIFKILKLFNNNQVRLENLNLIEVNNDIYYNIITQTLNKIALDSKDDLTTPLRSSINLENNKFNFYQIINFLKFLLAEFKKFFNCANLRSDIFVEDVPPYFNELKINIINSIIKNSRYIIELDDFEKDLLDERKNYEDKIKIFQYNQKEKSKKIDKLNPSFIAMHENENLFSIISSNKNCEILKNINVHISNINAAFSSNPTFKKFELVKTPSELDEEKSLNDNNLCKELLKIIIDENLQGDGDYKKIKEHLKNNFEDFLFTKDNFINMVMLYLRIRAGIPTILMGETGCGKTYLVKMFSLLFSQNAESFYCLKFHAGINDDDIIDFLEKTKEQVIEDENKIINELNEYFMKDKKRNKLSFRKAENKKKEEMWFYERWFFTSKYEEQFKRYDKGVKENIEKRIKKRKIIIFFDEINTC